MEDLPIACLADGLAVDVHTHEVAAVACIVAERTCTPSGIRTTLRK
jgi:hypothetical protein